jgi:hypothetical protein
MMGMMSAARACAGSTPSTPAEPMAHEAAESARGQVYERRYEMTKRPGVERFLTSFKPIATVT